jgi:hypothetical protein
MNSELYFQWVEVGPNCGDENAPDQLALLIFSRQFQFLRLGIGRLIVIDNLIGGW